MHQEKGNIGSGGLKRDQQTLVLLSLPCPRKVMKKRDEAEGNGKIQVRNAMKEQASSALQGGRVDCHLGGIILKVT